MNLPPAIREDHNPFAVLGLLGGLERFLVFVRWTSYKCPHCGQVFRRDYWPENVRLGSGVRLCRKCGGEFEDGSREWPQLALADKLRVFFPPTLMAIWAGFVVTAILSLFIGPRDEHSLGVVIIVSAFGLLPTLLWSPFPLYSVIRSHRRYSRGGQRQTA
jgi:predicted RNA-binding Zn-ribbon protein involved in translation (DUF1610 family)